MGTPSPGPGGAERGAPTSAELGVAAGAEDAEEAGLQGVAGVVAGDVSKFLGEESTVRRGGQGDGCRGQGKGRQAAPPGTASPEWGGWPLMGRESAFLGS